MLVIVAPPPMVVVVIVVVPAIAILAIVGVRNSGEASACGEQDRA
jgi:hypothetical protein